MRPGRLLSFFVLDGPGLSEGRSVLFLYIPILAFRTYFPLVVDEDEYHVLMTKLGRVMV